MNNQLLINPVRKLFDEVYSKGNIAICDELVANNVQIHDPAGVNQKPGLAGMKEREAMYRRAFPNLKVKIDEIMVADDKVIVRYTGHGTHKGEYEGMRPTNKEFRVTGIAIYKLVNGKISEMWVSWDRLGLLEQIGEIHHAHAHTGH